MGIPLNHQRSYRIFHEINQQLKALSPSGRPPSIPVVWERLPEPERFSTDFFLGQSLALNHLNPKTS